MGECIDYAVLRAEETRVHSTSSPVAVPLTGEERRGDGPHSHYILDRYQSLFLRSLSGAVLMPHYYGWDPGGPGKLPETYAIASLRAA